MVSAPPKPTSPPVQQSLIPESTGDYRILVPGYAGELAADEIDFIRDQLIRDRKLARLWGFRASTRRRSEQAIRALAFLGDPVSGRANAELARRPITQMA